MMNLALKPCTSLLVLWIVLFGVCEGASHHHGSSCHHGSSSSSDKVKGKKPHIVIMMADDLGFNDVSIHGSNQIPTPNIDALGIMGIQLNKMYSAPMCTPSRSALMTGKYESNLGMQHFVIPSDAPYGLDPKEKTIADFMKTGGYRNYLVGKWHLGFFEKRYTPLFRGFDSHFGYLGPYIDYFNHSLKMSRPSYDLASGYDMRKNLTTTWDTIGQYATDLFTEKAVQTIKNHDKNTPMFLFVSHLSPHAGNTYDPLQAPQDEINKFHYIRNKNRQTYAAMVSRLDKSVGKVVEALDKSNMLENSVILFLSDNGAPVEGEHANSGSNFPFRGQKDTPWEGAIRSAAAIWSPRLKCRQRVSDQLIHISDWLPTFAKLAGVSIDTPIDGKNVWNALSYNLPSPRRQLLCHHDPIVPYMAYIQDNFKVVSGTTYIGAYDGWLSGPIDSSEEDTSFGDHYSEFILKSRAGKSLSKFVGSNKCRGQRYVDARSRGINAEEIDNIRKKAKISCNGYTPPNNNSDNACDPIKATCLFDIKNDPCETTNLALEFPEIVQKLEAKLGYYGSIAKAPRNTLPDRRCDPANFGGVWTWWYDALNITTSASVSLSTEKYTPLFNHLCLTVVIIAILARHR